MVSAIKSLIVLGPRDHLKFQARQNAILKNKALNAINQTYCRLVSTYESWSQQASATTETESKSEPETQATSHLLIVQAGIIIETLNKIMPYTVNRSSSFWSRFKSNDDVVSIVMPLGWDFDNIIPEHTYVVSTKQLLTVSNRLVNALYRHLINLRAANTIESKLRDLLPQATTGANTYNQIAGELENSLTAGLNLQTKDLVMAVQQIEARVTSSDEKLKGLKAYYQQALTAKAVFAKIDTMISLVTKQGSDLNCNHVGHTTQNSSLKHTEICLSDVSQDLLDGAAIAQECIQQAKQNFLIGSLEQCKKYQETTLSCLEQTQTELKAIEETGKKSQGLIDSSLRLLEDLEKEISRAEAVISNLGQFAHSKHDEYLSQLSEIKQNASYYKNSITEAQKAQNICSFNKVIGSLNSTEKSIKLHMTALEAPDAELAVLTAKRNSCIKVAEQISNQILNCKARLFTSKTKTKEEHGQELDKLETAWLTLSPTTHNSDNDWVALHRTLRDISSSLVELDISLTDNLELKKLYLDCKQLFQAITNITQGKPVCCCSCLCEPANQTKIDALDLHLCDSSTNWTEFKSNLQELLSRWLFSKHQYLSLDLLNQPIEDWQRNNALETIMKAENGIRNWQIERDQQKRVIKITHCYSAGHTSAILYSVNYLGSNKQPQSFIDNGTRYTQKHGNVYSAYHINSGVSCEDITLLEITDQGDFIVEYINIHQVRGIRSLITGW
jgi:hypothetical protein